MRAFSELYEELDTTTSTNLKVAAMARYFSSAPPADAAWAAYILSGHRLKRFIGPALMYRWLIEACSLPQWLVEECRSTVGDLAESIALLMEGAFTGNAARSLPSESHGSPSGADAASPAQLNPAQPDPAQPDPVAAAPGGTDLPLAQWIEERLLPLRGADEDRQRSTIVEWWRTLPYRESFLVNKFLTGELRVGVSELLVTRALAEVLAIPRPDLARRLMGDWQPSAAFWESLRSGESATTDPSAPYPFFLASPLEAGVDALGLRERWQAEWKWDGIRSQLIRRGGECFIWSRGEDLVTARFPEIVTAASGLPDGVALDGELVAWRDGAVRPFSDLQQRIGRKSLSAGILAAVPVRFLAYDLLEEGGVDIRAVPLRERRQRLELLIASVPDAIKLSPVIEPSEWADLEALRGESRARGVEGLMLKALDSAYGTGRQRGSWWKWKIEPYSFDAVMLYAQPGHGRRSNLYTDYTFGVWSGTELVPVAKAYSGLSNAEIVELDRWIRTHTREKFGPVRSVEPTQVFELAYEGIAASSRHKSGIALRFPRILRRRADKPAEEADTLVGLQEVLAAHLAPSNAVPAARDTDPVAS